jgi:metal-sulfur cluster biosynthetic enzyme
MTRTVSIAITRARVLAALDGVIDPELDESIIHLRFVSFCSVSEEGDVEVGIRLPTPQCAPNFAFLIVADARNAVRALPEVRDVRITLLDHYTGNEINTAVNRGAGFTAAFPGETNDDALDALRDLFLRKALLARQARICESLLREGLSVRQAVALRVRSLPDGGDVRRCLQLREQLGLTHNSEAPAFVSGTGEALTADQLQQWLRMGRLVRTSLEANGGLCRSLLQFRYSLPQEDEDIVR